MTNWGQIPINSRLLADHGVIGVRFQLIHACLPNTAGSSAAHRRKRQRSLRGPTHHVRKLKWLDWSPKWLKTIFRTPFQPSPKHHLKPHGLGTIF